MSRLEMGPAGERKFTNRSHRVLLCYTFPCHLTRVTRHFTESPRYSSATLLSSLLRLLRLRYNSATTLLRPNMQQTPINIDLLRPRPICRPGRGRIPDAKPTPPRQKFPYGHVSRS